MEIKVLITFFSLVAIEIKIYIKIQVFQNLAQTVFHVSFRRGQRVI